MTDDDPLLGLDAAAFAAHLRSTFDVRRDPPGVLELVEVEDLGSTPGHERFSLSFRGAGDFLGQGMQTLAHPGLGELTLFLVPVARDAGGVVYEASFNRFPTAWRRAGGPDGPAT